MKEFDKKAASWDDDPKKVERSKVIATKIKEHFKDQLFIDALEYGSGTGLLGFELLEILSNLTLMDESLEMTKGAQLKAGKIESKKVNAIQYDLLNDPIPKQKIDLIFTLLTMHHIKDTDAILLKFNEILKPGGLLLIIDLVKEDGNFHDGDFDGHKGFDREILEARLLEHSFLIVDYLNVYTIVKSLEDGRTIDYPLFLSISQKIK